MLRDMLPAIFQLATGLGFVIFLAAVWTAGSLRSAMWGRLIFAALLMVPLSFLVMSWGVKESTLGHAAPMLVVGGGVMLLAALFAAAGLILAARRPAARDASA